MAWTHIVASALKLAEKVVNDVPPMVGVNEPQGIETTPFLVGRARGGVFGEVCGHQLQCLLFMSLSTETQRS